MIFNKARYFAGRFQGDDTFRVCSFSSCEAEYGPYVMLDNGEKRSYNLLYFFYTYPWTENSSMNINTAVGDMLDKYRYNEDEAPYDTIVMICAKNVRVLRGKVEYV